MLFVVVVLQHNNDAIALDNELITTDSTQVLFVRELISSFS